MMKLSTMKAVMETIDSGWKSPLANTILERWGYDEGTVFFWRASANFVFIFKRNGKNLYLRFNEVTERERKFIQGEVDVLHYLKGSTIRAAQPILSLNDQYVETVVCDIGTYHAVVFEAMPGEHLELDEMSESQLHDWGCALGDLHACLKNAPEELLTKRPSWRDQLLEVREMLPANDKAARLELERCLKWAEQLPSDRSGYGIIHYDFELDNHRWVDGEIGILDFDDCSVNWFAADIAYALRDVMQDQNDLKDHRVQAFIHGYRMKTELDEALLSQLDPFMRMHDLVMFAKLIRSVDGLTELGAGEKLESLREKLANNIAEYRKKFEETTAE